MNDSDGAPPFIRVPPELLSFAARRGVIEAFIAREGTDYGEVEWSLEEKVAQLEKALVRGDAVVVFDPLTETCSVLPREALPRD